MELKLIRAGAGKETVKAAIRDRADADIAATLARTGSVDDDAFGALDQRLLGMASSIANLAALGGSPGATPARPAEHIYSTLMSRPADLTAVDATSVFDGDHRLVVGHLCNLSDQCHFRMGIRENVVVEARVCKIPDVLTTYDPINGWPKDPAWAPSDAEQVASGMLQNVTH